MLEEFGSGVYDLYVKNAEKRLLYHDQAPFHNEDFPPKVDPNEVVKGHPDNAVYFTTTWAKRNGAGAHGRPEKGEQGNRDIDIAEVLRAHSEGNKLDPQLLTLLPSTAQGRDALAGELAEASAKNASPDLLAIIRAIKDATPSEKPDNTLAVLAAVKQIAPQPSDPLEVLERAKQIFAAPPANASDDDLVRLERVLTIADRLAGLRGTNPGTESGWQTALSFVKEAPAVISPILQFIGQQMAMRRGQPAPQAAPGAPAAPAAWDPYANPSATASYAASMRKQESAPQPASASAPTSPSSAATAPYPASGSPTPPAGAVATRISN
jgi:hypothetical protein